MYEGWYRPNTATAAAKTFYIDDSSGTTIATGVVTNTVSTTNPTSATPTPDINILNATTAVTTSNRTTGTYTAGATMLESIYNTAYASATTVTGTSYFGRLRDGSGGYTVGFQLFYVAANGTKTNFTGSVATQTLTSGASADYTVSLSGQSATVPAGAKLGIRVIYVSGSSTDARVYYGSTAAVSGGAGGVVIVDETAADSTPPTVSSTTPANGATGVTPNTSLVVTWNENINCATVGSADITMPGPPSVPQPVLLRPIPLLIPSQDKPTEPPTIIRLVVSVMLPEIQWQRLQVEVTQQLLLYRPTQI